MIFAVKTKGLAFESRFGFKDLRGWVYVPELCEHAGVKRSTIYSWNTFKEGKFLSIGSFKFASDSCYPSRSYGRYKQAAKKCTDLSNLYPLGALQDLLGVSSGYFNNRGKERLPVTYLANKAVFVKVPEQVLEHFRKGDTVRIVTSSKDLEYYSKTFIENGIRFGIM